MTRLRSSDGWNENSKLSIVLTGVSRTVCSAKATLRPSREEYAPINYSSIASIAVISPRSRCCRTWSRTFIARGMRRPRRLSRMRSLTAVTGRPPRQLAVAGFDHPLVLAFQHRMSGNQFSGLEDADFPGMVLGREYALAGPHHLDPRNGTIAIASRVDYRAANWTDIGRTTGRQELYAHLNMIAMTGARPPT